MITTTVDEEPADRRPWCDDCERIGMTCGRCRRKARDDAREEYGDE